MSQGQKDVGIKLIVFLNCLAYLWYNMVANGLLPTSVSSIQTRYQLQSVEVGVINGLADAGSFVMLLVVILLGSSVNKPRWLAAGTLLVAVGCIIFALPHFIAPEYQFEQTFVNHCGNITEPQCGNTQLRKFRFVFMCGTILMGAGIGEMFTHGVTYIDENANTIQSSIFISIYYIMTAIGPVVGFFLGGALTKLFVNPEIVVEITSSHVLWVGAWWPGYIIVGGLSLLAAIPFPFLPEKVRRDENNTAEPPTVGDAESNYIATIKQNLSEVKDLFSNKIHLLCSFIISMNHALMYGFNTFAVKYVEVQYGLDTFIASVVYGVALVTAMTAAYAISGFVMGHYKLEIKGLINFCLANALISVIFTFGFFFFCKSGKFAGGTVPYAHETKLNIESNCNMECGCSRDWYNPVLGSDGVHYFSPCYAGCVASFGNETFSNCSCVLDNEILLNQTATGAAIEVANIEEFCILIVGFALITGLALFSTIITISPTLQISLRRLEVKRRPSAIGLQQLIAMALGNLPGRIVSGRVLDLTCVAWSTKCGETASCKVYDKWHMAFYSFLLLIGEAILILAGYIAIYFLHKNETKKNSSECHDNPNFALHEL